MEEFHFYCIQQKIVHKMFVSKDQRLIKTAGYTIAELYLQYDEFKEIVMGKFE